MDICQEEEDDSPILHKAGYFSIQNSQVVGDKTLLKNKRHHKNMEFIVKLS